MSYKTPTFWYSDKSAEATMRRAALRPAAWLYKIAFCTHQTLVKPRKVDVPVICIGNLVAGGTGKTPSAIAILNFIREHHIAENPFFLLRGYGGAERGPLLVDSATHNAWDVGDESLILAKHAPTIVSADRVDGAKLAIENGSDLVIMDDGLQNPGIHKDLKLVVINGEMGFGNKMMIPAGPLREPLEKGLQKADAFMLIGEDSTDINALIPAGKPLIRAHLKADPDFKIDKDKRYLAFAGLGYPEKFFGFLKNTLGLNVVESVAFADHCPYESEDLQKLYAQAQKLEAELITTTKDHMRLPEIEGVGVHCVPVSLHIDTPELLKPLLEGLKV